MLLSSRKPSPEAQLHKLNLISWAQDVHPSNKLKIKLGWKRRTACISSEGGLQWACPLVIQVVFLWLVAFCCQGRFFSIYLWLVTLFLNGKVLWWAWHGDAGWLVFNVDWLLENLRFLAFDVFGRVWGCQFLFNWASLPWKASHKYRAKKLELGAWELDSSQALKLRGRAETWNPCMAAIVFASPADFLLQ